MKTKLKQNSGFAVAGVIAVLAIASLMGTALFAYSVTSLRSVRFATEDTKAEYLAQAGVEIGTYAYQSAVLGSSDIDDTSYANFVADLADPDVSASSTEVHLVWDKSSRKYKFTNDTSYLSNTDNYLNVGYFTVKLTTSELEYYNAYSDIDPTTGYPKEKIKGYARVVTATGHSGKQNKTYTSTGYFPDTLSASGSNIYSADGIIQSPKSGKGNFTSVGDDVKVDIDREFTTRIMKWLTGQNSFTLGSINITPYAFASVGNLILDKPRNSDTIRFYDPNNTSPTIDSNSQVNSSNAVTFVAGDSIFVNANIDVTPTKGGLNAISLVGQNIVINGNVELYVYCLPDTSNQTLIRSIINTATRGYGIGKLVVSVPITFDESTKEKVPHPAYTDKLGNSILEGASFMTAGKIFFGGNVTITVEIANEGKHRYRAFNAGDVYYFDSNAKVMAKDTTGGNREVYGIDLMQYFFERAVNNGEYGTKTLRRFNTILDFYFSDPDVNGGKHINKYTGLKDGSKDVDVLYIIPKNNVRRYKELVPPTPFSASTINWGPVPGSTDSGD